MKRLLKLESARVLLVESQSLIQKAMGVLRDIDEAVPNDNGKHLIDSQNTIDIVLRYIMEEIQDTESQAPDSRVTELIECAEKVLPCFNAYGKKEFRELKVALQKVKKVKNE